METVPVLVGSKAGAEMPADGEAKPDKQKREEGVAQATKAYLLGVVLPLWTVPGLADWICHRKSKIEKTSGSHESLTHSLMMASIGIPAMMALLLEINAAVIAALAAGVAVHEAIVIWDVAYASGRRKVTPTEMHFHSFLEVIPVMSLSFVACLHWDQVIALAGMGPNPPDLSLRWKERPIHAGYLAAVFALLTATVGIPYAEELLRCLREDRTLAPHPKPDPPVS